MLVTTPNYSNPAFQQQAQQLSGQPQTGPADAKQGEPTPNPTAENQPQSSSQPSFGEKRPGGSPGVRFLRPM